MSVACFDGSEPPKTDYEVKPEPSNVFCYICFSDLALRHLFHPDYKDGKSEIYTEMILYCFNIAIVAEANCSSDNCMICEECVGRLKNAYAFKLQIENAQKGLNKHTDSSKNPGICEDFSYLVKAELSDDEIDSNDYLHGKPVIRKSREGRKLKIKRLSTKQNVSDLEWRLKLQQYKSNKDNLVCDICNEAFRQHAALIQHLSVHFPKFICDICGKFYTDKRNLKNHVVRHNNVQHSCPICNKTCKGSDNLKKHLKLHKDPHSRYKCPNCAETFKNYCTRVRHLIDVHGVDHKPYKCKQCTKDYPTSSRLNEHVRRDHLQERNFHCAVCRTAFFSKYSLVIHMQKHTGERNFHCRVCEKSFGRKTHLISHMKIHTNERQFECVVCNRRFIQKGTLKRHLKTHREISVQPENED